MITEREEKLINEYYFNNYYPKLDIFKIEKNINSKQYIVKLSINYDEFLAFLKNTGIILQTKICIDGNLQYKFLSYPNCIISGYDDYLLNHLMHTAYERGIGILINPQILYKYQEEKIHRYHIGDYTLPEYIAIFDIKRDGSNNCSNNEYFVRTLIDSVHRWVKVEPIVWTFDKESNQLISDNITFQFDEDVIDNKKYLEHINNVLYREMNYHPEQYLSDNISDKMIISYQLCKYENHMRKCKGENKTKQKIR